MQPRTRPKWEGRVALGLLALGLALATYPAWRVLALPRDPTFDELLRVICTSPAAGPPPRLRRAAHGRGVDPRPPRAQPAG